MARQAVRLAKQCLHGPGETHPARAEILIRVSLACAWTFRAGGGREAVDQAVAEARNAVSAAPEGGLLRRKASLALASALEQRFDEFRSTGDLSEAIAICRVHARSPEEDPVGRSHRSLLAECLQLRYEAIADERDEVELATAEWIDWYNFRRLHGEIGHVPPAEYEASHYQTTQKPQVTTTI
ncbi:integrase core domain-containing protein [Streptomyces europaeiscabiei]|uniref:integrase core domain-containing protein n=1 Tax=Streptomyces europaeiscabiei TaxID=146819 RepID=UPI002E2BF345|nr:integrase core domain-containing protein [Streptomyces europaeiscabiei]